MYEVFTVQFVEYFGFLNFVWKCCSFQSHNVNPFDDLKMYSDLCTVAVCRFNAHDGLALNLMCVVKC